MGTPQSRHAAAPRLITGRLPSTLAGGPVPLLSALTAHAALGVWVTLVMGLFVVLTVLLAPRLADPEEPVLT